MNTAFIQSLYAESERLHSISTQLREAGKIAGADHVRDAACDLLRAISSLVKERVTSQQEGAA